MKKSFGNLATLALLTAAIVVFGCDLGTIVEVVEVARIEVPHEVEPIQEGFSLALSATPVSDKGEELDRALNWSSSNTAVATVSAEGRVTAVSSGSRVSDKATITASTDGVSTSITIYSVKVRCPIHGTLRPGDSVTGTLTNECDLVRDDRFVDAWFLEISSSATVQIDMTSSSFDTYLYLRDDLQSFLIDDDDGGNGTNARFTEFLAPGIYVILAGSFNNELGPYQLSVATL